MEMIREVGSKASLRRKDSNLIVELIVNLGKWVLRNLFDTLVSEELRRDELYRRSLRKGTGSTSSLHRPNAPSSIVLPDLSTQDPGGHLSSTSSTTPRPVNGSYLTPGTPGLGIGAATPSGLPHAFGTSLSNHLPPTAEEETGLERKLSREPRHTVSSDKLSDYFSTAPGPVSEGAPVNIPQSSSDAREEKKKGSLFGKKFQMSFPAMSMKLGRTPTEAKPTANAEEKAEDTSDKSSEVEEKVFEDNLYGVVQKIRHDYEEQIKTSPDQRLAVGITPSSPSETPVLKLPVQTLVIIQEDNPESGGVADLYRGAIESLGTEADEVEKVAPMWLGELLLKAS